MNSVRRRQESLSGLDHRARSSFVPTLMYPHVSTFRSTKMDVHIYSPSKMESLESGHRHIPVFGDNDQVGGKVLLSDTIASATGKLTIIIEGAFKYTVSEPEEIPGYPASAGSNRKHVFFSATTAIPVSPSSDATSFPRSIPRPSSRTALREAFKRRPSISSLKSPPLLGDRAYPFMFELPRGARSHEDIPATFSPSKTRFSENSEDQNMTSSPFEVEYNILVVWESSDGSDYSTLNIPFLLHSDADFQSLDGVSEESQESWLEMPLRGDRPMSFKCAVTLPTSVTFSRSSSIPYFVVFTTNPRSPTLAREIAADATVSVSIQRQISVLEPAILPPSPPETPSSSEECDLSRGKLFKRIRGRIPRSPSSEDGSSPGFSCDSREKPLPRVPVYSETSTLHTDISIGFTKRPRQQCEGQKHPSLNSQSSLPDGLLKSKILLNRAMLPCIDWAGLSVKYYLDISVMVGQEDLRARIPIRII